MGRGLHLNEDFSALHVAHSWYALGCVAQRSTQLHSLDDGRCCQVAFEGCRGAVRMPVNAAGTVEGQRMMSSSLLAVIW
jgi:hypothetical protein